MCGSGTEEKVRKQVPRYETFPHGPYRRCVVVFYQSVILLKFFVDFVFVVPGMEPRASYMVGKHFTTEPHANSMVKLSAFEA